MIDEARIAGCEMLVIGHEPVACIEATVRRDGVAGVTLVDLRARAGDDRKTVETAVAEIVQQMQPRRIFCSFGGSEPWALGLAEAAPPFDFVTPTRGTTLAGRARVPYAQVRAALEHAMQDALTGLRQLVRLRTGAVTHFCAPPPVQSIDAGDPIAQVFAERLDHGVSPASLRLKLYELYCDIWRDACAVSGAAILEAPPGCRDDAGFLLEHFRDLDPMRGNADFGALLLQQMQAVSRD